MIYMSFSIRRLFHRCRSSRPLIFYKSLAREADGLTIQRKGSQIGADILLEQANLREALYERIASLDARFIRTYSDRFHPHAQWRAYITCRKYRFAPSHRCC